MNSAELYKEVGKSRTSDYGKEYQKLSDWQDKNTVPTSFGLYQVENSEVYAYYGENGWCCPAYAGGKEQAMVQYFKPLYPYKDYGPMTWRGLVDE